MNDWADISPDDVDADKPMLMAFSTLNAVYRLFRDHDGTYIARGYLRHRDCHVRCRYTFAETAIGVITETVKVEQERLGCAVNTGETSCRK